MRAPIYSKIEYGSALDSRKNYLEIQASLLRIIKCIENYKILRKKELLDKIKLKTNSAKVKNSIKKIINDVPNAKFNFENKTMIKKSKKNNGRMASIESELADIQRKLEEMNKGE